MSTSFTPLSIPNCALWLDAADTTTVTLSASNVTSWSDKSGNGRNATATGTIPFTSNINGITTPAFSGVANTYFRGASSNAGVRVSAFAVYVQSNTSTGNNRIVSLGTVGVLDYNNTQSAAAILMVNPNFVSYRDGAQLSAISGTFGVPSLSVAVFTGLTNTFYLNGTAGSTVSSSGNFNYSNYQLASSFAEEPTNTLVGTIGEVILYNTAVSTSQRQQVEGYLAWKWNLVSLLPASHPYKLAPPTGSTLSIISTPTFTGTEYIRRPFSYTFSSTITDYPTTLQFIDSTPALLSSVSGDIFFSTTGFQGTPGSAGTLIVDALAASNTAFSTLFAGYTRGFTNGTGDAAQFNSPAQMAFDGSGNMFVADSVNDSIRKITPQGVVTTFFNFPPSTGPAGVVIDRDSNLYVSLTGGYRIEKITPSGSNSLIAGSGAYGFADGTGAAAQFSFLGAMAIDSNTNVLYVADSFNYAIRKVTPTGVVTTIAGNGTVGNADGVGSNARFSEMKSVLLASDGFLYVPDAYNNKIRRINLATNAVTTYAGTGTTGSNNATLTTSTFNFPYDITQDSESNFYVADTFNYLVRKITSNTVTTYAGTGTPGYADGLSAKFTPRHIQYYNNNVYLTDNDSAQPISSTIRSITAFQKGNGGVRPGGNSPAGFVIASSISTPVTVLSRLDVSTTAINNVFQLYKYEPFGGNTFTRVLPGDTLSFARSSGQIITSLTSNANVITFASSNGYQSSFSNLQLIVDVLSNGIIVDSNSNSVNVGVGRFFPPISNTAYTFYKNETITPVRFSTVLPVGIPLSSPTLPPGLSFVQVNSNTYDLTGTPLLETPNSNYLVIGNGTGSNAGKTVTTTISIVVNGERVNLDVSGTLNYTGLIQDVSLSPNTTVTARYPAGGAIRYTWSPALLPGFKFTDSTGSQQSGNSIFPTDLSGSITLSGAPTANAIQILAASKANSYSVNLTATRFTPSPNITATKTFTFDFSAAVYFDQVSTPTLFAGIPVPSNSVYFGAKTVLSTTDASISDIFLVDGSLPGGLALTFSNVEGRAYINGTPSSTVSPQFTLRASNTSGITQDYTTTLTIINDTVSFTNPLVDACYNFIQFKPLSNITPGWYTYPIEFRASAASLCNVVMTTSDLNGTGLSLVSVGSNTYQLSGTPTSSKALTTLNVTATAAVSGAFATNNKVKYSISADVITIDPVTISGIQNREITPIQFSGSSLSGRPIIAYTSSTVPPGLTLTSTGNLFGIPTSNGTGIMTVTATTGYSFTSSNFPYTINADSIILTTNQSSYLLTTGQPVPSIEVFGVSYSGIDVSNFRFSNLTPTYGMTIGNNTGIFGGTFTTGVPPDDPLPSSPDSFEVYANAGTIDSSLEFTLSKSTSTVTNSFMTIRTTETDTGSRVIYSTSNLSNFQVFYDLSNNFYETGVDANFTSSGLRNASLTDQTALFSYYTYTTDISTGIPSYDKGKVLRISNTQTVQPNITVDASAGWVITGVLNRPGTNTWWAIGIDMSSSINQPGQPLNFYVSSNDGITWGPRSTIRDENNDPLISAFDDGNIYPSTPFKFKDNILLLGGVSFDSLTSGLVRSSNYGSTWERVPTCFSGLGSEVWDINVEDSNVWVATGYANTESQLLYTQYSTDKGETWQEGTGIINYNSSLGESSIAYGSNTWLTSYDNHLYFSRDGSNWTQCDVSSEPWNYGENVYQANPIVFDGSNFKVMASDLSYRWGVFSASPTTDFSYNDWTFQDISLSPPETSWGSNFLSVTSLLPPYSLTTESSVVARLDVNAYPLGPTFTAPTIFEYVFNQYVPISPITFSASGTGTVFYFINNDDLPQGFRFNPITATISGTPGRTGTFVIRVFAKDDVGVTIITLTFTIIIPRIVKQQSSASAYTSLVRQYTVVNAAQNARGSRVLIEDGKQGEFMAPMGTDNLIPNNCFICDPNSTSNANI